MKESPARKANRETAKETVKILAQGYYDLPDGKRMYIRDLQKMAEDGTELIRPEDWDAVFAACETLTQNAGYAAPGQVYVCNESTFSAARRLRRQYEQPVLALNFASGMNPGGGFLNGARAQEEALCRGSGLYGCISDQQAYYAANRAGKTSLFTDHMIYSPDVPVFRDDRDVLTPTLFKVSMLTAPAPKMKAIQQDEPGKVELAKQTMRDRIEKVLAFAYSKGYQNLVLGAWGCGAYGNNADEVARDFAHFLYEDPRYKGRFKEVVFAILDTSPEQKFIGPFIHHLQK